MSRKYEVKRGDLVRINAYYRPEEAEALEVYKERKGYKIGRGFKDSPEFKSIQRRKNRSLRRAEVKKEAQEVAELTINNPGKKTDWDEVTAPDGTTITPVNEDGPQPFYSELSYGGGSDKEVVSQWKLAQTAGRKVVGIINNTFEGKTVYSYDLFTFKQRIKSLYSDLKKQQSETNTYPQISTNIVDDGTTITIVVEAHG